MHGPVTPLLLSVTFSTPAAPPLIKFPLKIGIVTQLFLFPPLRISYACPVSTESDLWI